LFTVSILSKSLEYFFLYLRSKQKEKRKLADSVSNIGMELEKRAVVWCSASPNECRDAQHSTWRTTSGKAFCREQVVGR
jgi:hypothetical protein